jgi:hypothetical protein
MVKVNLTGPQSRMRQAFAITDAGEEAIRERDPNELRLDEGTAA